MRRNLLFTLLIATLPWSAGAVVPVASLDRARSLADNLADQIHQYLDRAQTLAQNRQANEVSAQDFARDLRLLSHDFAAGAEQRSLEPLLASVPAGSFVQRATACLNPAGELALMLGANFVATGLGIAGGCTHFVRVAYDPANWHGHLAASVVIGTVGTFASMGAIAGASFGTYHAIQKFYRARLRGRGLADRFEVRDAFAARLRERGVQPIYTEVRAEDFGGAGRPAQTALLGHVARRVNAPPDFDLDPTWATLALVAEHRLFNDYPIVDILLYGPDPILSAHCQSALMKSATDGEPAEPSSRRAKQKADFLNELNVDREDR